MVVEFAVRYADRYIPSGVTGVLASLAARTMLWYKYFFVFRSGLENSSFVYFTAFWVLVRSPPESLTIGIPRENSGTGPSFRASGS